MKRPLSITIIGWLFIVAGSVGIAYHFPELMNAEPSATEAILVLFVRLLAIAGGILVLRAANIGRWMLMAWMMYHVVLSFYHPVSELVFHALLLALLVFVFFQPRVVAFFAQGKSVG
jgi:hypothetical protein